MSFSPTQMMKARTVADAVAIDYFEIPPVPVVRRRCQVDGCGTVLRQSNQGRLCAVHERKREMRAYRDNYCGIEGELHREGGAA